MEATLKYFKDANRILEANEFEDQESHDLFINNVFAEVEGLEYRLSCHHDGSFILEKLLLTAQSFHLRVFFEKVREKWWEMCSHRYASHVVKGWVLGAVRRLALAEEEVQENVEGLPKLEEQLHSISEFIIEDVVKYLEDPYATHTVRLFFKLWLGELDAKINNGSALYDRFVESVFSLPSEVFSLSSALSHQHVSPVLQELINGDKSGQITSKITSQLFPTIFSASGPSSNDSLEKEQKKFVKIIDSEVASHFFECLIKSLNASQFLLFFNKLVKSQIESIIQGSYSNFVLQTLISAAHNQSQFEMILESLKSYSTELITNKRHGILLRLVQWVINHDLSCAQPTMNFTFEAFHLKDSHDRKNSFIAFSRLQTKDNINPEAPLNAAGCSLLQLLVHFPSSCAKPIIDGFLEYSVSSLVEMASHPNGSRVIEAAFNSNEVSETAKLRTVRKLRDHVASLSMDKFGSHVVEKCWLYATPEIREKIIVILLQSKAKLLDSTYGKMVMRKCKIEDYERNQEQWKAAQEGEERKKAMFADLLEDETDSLLPQSMKVEIKQKGKRRYVDPVKNEKSKRNNNIDS